jgi:hypothetical protein
LVLLVTPPLGAQIVLRGPGGPGDASALLDVAPAAYGVSAWKTGEWARYNVTQTFGQTGQSLTRFRTLSVVGAAGDKFWVEVNEESMGVMRAVQPSRKMLIPFGPVAERHMVEAVTLMNDSSIRRTTVVRPASAERGKPPFPEGWERVGEDTVTTPAGEFPTRRYRRGDEELWAAAAAGPIGLVRYRGAAVTIELVARGATGAKSKIPEIAR